MTEDPQVSQIVASLQDEIMDNKGLVDSQSEIVFDRDMAIHYEQRIQFIEEKVQELQNALLAFPDVQEKQKEEFRKRMAEFDGLKSRMKDISHSFTESNRAVHNMEKRVDGVKNYATSGVISSVLVFSILLVISMLMRSQ